MVDKVPKRKVKCNTCGREFFSAMPEDKIRCFCQSKDVSVIPPTEQELGNKETLQGTPFVKKPRLKGSLSPTASITLSPSTLAYANRLIHEKGMFPDIDNVVNRAVEMLATQIESPKFVDYMFKGGVKMPEEEPNPEKEIKKIQANDIIETYLDKKKAEAQAIREKFQKGEATKSELLNVMKEQFEIKQLNEMMSNLEGGGGGLKDIKEMLSMKWMMDMMMTEKGSSGKNNGEVLELQKKIDDLQKQIDKQDTLNEIRKIAGNNKGMGTDDYLKLFADKWEAVEKQKIETEKAKQDALKEREERYAAEREHQLEQVQGNIKNLEEKLEKAKEKGSSIGKISEMKEQIKELREFAKEFGEQAKEKSTGEIASELILGVAEKLKEPISHAAKGFADKQAAERMRAQGQPVYIMPENPGPSVTQPIMQPSIPETPSYHQETTPDLDIVNTFAEQNTSKKHD